MNKPFSIAVLFGTAHGLNDFIAGYLLAHLSSVSTNWQLNTLSFLVYSLLAFGGQLPAGMLVDKVRKIRGFSMLSLLLMVAAIAISYLNIYAAILFSGFASAFIHVCGGTACYLSDNKSATLSGIFTAPGVVGLITGGIAAGLHFEYFHLFVLPLVLLLVWLMKEELPVYVAKPESDEAPLLDSHDFFMLILLMAIAFRSLWWNVVHMMCFNYDAWLLGIGCSAGAGKLLGGYISDKVDWKKFIFISMSGAVLSLHIGRDYFPLMCVGVALLQSAVPLTLLLMQQYLQSTPATASGLSLGIAIVLAGLPAYTEQFRLVQRANGFWLLLGIAFIVSNFWLLRSFHQKIGQR